MLRRLAAGETILGDGGWGTMLMARGLQPGDCPEMLNLEHPELLAEIAELYLEAGADFITTNTFGGSPLKLEHSGLADRCAELNRRGVEIVRQVVGGRALVAASVGPCGRLLKPYGDIDPETVGAGFERQIAALAEAGADLIVIETMTDAAEAEQALAAAKTEAPGLPVVATMTFDATPRGFFTIMGVTVEEAARRLADAGADVVGSNCGHGIGPMIEIARAFRTCTDLPVAIQANAGLPENRDDQLVWPEDPETWADGAVTLRDLGVGLIGGCCGTTPEHIRALRRGLDS